MTIHTLAADICDRIPEMARDCKINNQKVIETMIREFLDSKEKDKESEKRTAYGYGDWRDIY